MLDSPPNDPGCAPPSSMRTPGHPFQEVLDRIRFAAAALSDTYEAALSYERRMNRLATLAIDAVAQENRELRAKIERLEREYELVCVALRQAKGER